MPQTILSSLWHSRHARQSWSSTTIVSIGRRLVEVRFSLPAHRAGAIDLCQDICYNLQRVWGAFDPTTLSMFRLLSALYAAENNHKKALSLRGDVLKNLLTAYEEDGTVEESQGAIIAVDELRLLKRTYLRCGGWDSNREEWEELFGNLNDAFHGQGCWKASKTASLGIDKWDASGKFKADDKGVWSPPTEWEFLAMEEDKAKAVKHQNNLRKTSGWIPSLGKLSNSASLPAFQGEDAAPNVNRDAAASSKRQMCSSKSYGPVQPALPSVVAPLHTHLDYQAPQVAIPSS